MYIPLYYVPRISAMWRNDTLRTAARYGAILGGLNGLFAVLNLFVPMLASIDGFLSVIAGLVLLTLIGMEVGRARGAATPAMFAGMLASATAWAINALVVVALTLAFTGTYREQLALLAQKQHQSIASLTNGTIIAGNLLLLVFFLCVALAFGAFLGGMGGLFGRRQARHQVARQAAESTVAPTVTPPMVSPSQGEIVEAS